jgi:adenylate cyclase
MPSLQGVTLESPRLGRALMQVVPQERSDAEALPSGNATSTVRFAGLVFDLSACTLVRESGQAIPLTPGEFRLLRLFVSRPGRVLSRDAILEAVANRPLELFDRSVDALVGRLRRKIEPDPKTPRLIATVPGEGYRFDGLAPALRGALFDSAAESHREVAAEPAAEFDGASAPAKRKPVQSALANGARPLAAAFLLLAGLVAAGWYGFVRSAPTPVAGSHIPSIAVLPFDDLSPDKSLGYLGDGMSEDIITMLSRFPDLAVVARNSSFVYKGKPVDSRQIGRDLNVDYALEGSVRKEADQVRITAQLIDTETGKHVWANRYDRTGKDPLALQDEVTGMIIGAMTGEKGQIKQGQYRDAWGKDTADLGEYDYYLRGHDVFMNATSREENDRAGKIWEEGLTKYPNSSLLKVKLGFYHFEAGWDFWTDDVQEEFRKSAALAKSVLAQENLTPQVKRLAHWLNATVLTTQNDFDRAQTEAEAAISMAPYDAYAIGNLAMVPIAAGQPDKALQWIDLAFARDPNRAKVLNYKKGWALRLLRKYEDSLAAFKQAFMDGDAPLNMAIDLVRLGRIDEAKAQVKLMLEKNDPKFTQAKWRQGYFYSDPSIVDGEVADLAKAGLPEK